MFDEIHEIFKFLQTNLKARLITSPDHAKQLPCMLSGHYNLQIISFLSTCAFLRVPVLRQNDDPEHLGQAWYSNIPSSLPGQLTLPHLAGVEGPDSDAEQPPPPKYH